MFSSNWIEKNDFKKCMVSIIDIEVKVCEMEGNMMNLREIVNEQNK